MFDIPVRDAMERRKVLKAGPQASVGHAARLMAKANAGAVMVVVDDTLAGIFTERDIAFRVVARKLDPETTAIARVMTSSPQTIGPDEPFGRALLIMHENRFRHLPVVEGGKVIGVVSARSAMDPDLEEFAVEAARRRSFARQR